MRVLLDSARWSASCFNEQPWRFIVATKANLPAYEKMLTVLVPKNQLWAENAPVLMITAGKRTYTHNGQSNPFGLHDAGMALATLMIQATSMGLSVQAMGGHDRDRARAVFDVPEDFELGAAVAIGYRGEPDALAPDLERENTATSNIRCRNFSMPCKRGSIRI